MCKLLIKKLWVILFLFSFFAESRGMKEKEDEEELKIEKFWRAKNVIFKSTYRCFFLGDAEVGKIKIIKRFESISFNDNYVKTKEDYATSFYIKVLTNKGTHVIRFAFWKLISKDSLEKFSLENSFFFFVYDVTNRKSFENITNWLEEVKEEVPKDAKFVLIGNKIDLENQRQVPTEEGRKFADDNGMKFIEVSAKDGTNLGYTEIENAAGTNNGLENILKDFNEEYLKKQPVQQVIYPVVVQPEQPVIMQWKDANSCCQQCYPDDCCK